jgi:hypothetical protein
MKTVDELIKACRSIPNLNEYATYLGLRKQGLRKPALAALDVFILATLSKDERSKLEICQFIWGASKHLEDSHIVPESLSAKVIKPVFDKWLSENPDNLNAVKAQAQITYDEHNLWLLLELNPDDVWAREVLFERVCVRELRYAFEAIEVGQDFFPLPDEAVSSILKRDTVC